MGFFIATPQSGRFQYRSVVEALTTIATTEGPRGEQKQHNIACWVLLASTSAFVSLWLHTVRIITSTCIGAFYCVCVCVCTCRSISRAVCYTGPRCSILWSIPPILHTGQAGGHER